jgi:hypothetical protein
MRALLSTIAVTLIGAVGFAALERGSATGDPGSPPAMVLWAWQRSEDLRKTDPRTVGAAVLSRTITIARDRVVVEPRLQPIRVPPTTRVIAVVRIETSALDDAPDPSKINEFVRAVTVAAVAGYDGIQIVFDALVS